MAMAHKGLAKLLEELGELSQIASKKLAYIDTDDHPDHQGSMKKRMEDEMADVCAAIAFVIDKMDLDAQYIHDRYNRKVNRFMTWDKQP